MYNGDKDFSSKKETENSPIAPLIIYQMEPTERRQFKE
jgi:hypothetical protein